jgi:hypothetical protein
MYFIKILTNNNKLNLTIFLNSRVAFNDLIKIISMLSDCQDINFYKYF